MTTIGIFTGSSLKISVQTGVVVVEGINLEARDPGDRWRPFAYLTPGEAR